MVAAVEEGGPMVVDVMSIEVGVDAKCDSVVECRVCVLITDEVVLSVPVVLGLLVDVEEGPEEVTGMLVWTEGVGVLWEVVSVGVIVSVVAVVVMALVVVPVVCAVREEGMVFAVVADILETMGVEVRLIVVVSGPVEGLGVVGVGVSSVVRVSVPTEDWVVVVMVSGVLDVDVVLVDVTVVSTPPVVAAVVEGGPMVVDVVYIVVGMGARCDSVVEWRVCVLITDEVVLSVPVVLGLLVDVEEGPEEVTGMLVGTEGVVVL
ncbi:Gdp-Fucose Protein O-Fucosyltransferase 2 [Manis pentadactyla]|nr:Gdp-Fucose Protein O-Fucosyltransferase 2 [Manis pentadactyla]